MQWRTSLHYKSTRTFCALVSFYLFIYFLPLPLKHPESATAKFPPKVAGPTAHTHRNTPPPPQGAATSTLSRCKIHMSKFQTSCASYILKPVSLTIFIIMQDKSVNEQPLVYYTLSNIQQAHPKVLFEVAARPAGTWFLHFLPPCFFCSCTFSCHIFLLYLFPCCILFASVIHPSPRSGIII